MSSDSIPVPPKVLTPTPPPPASIAPEAFLKCARLVLARNPFYIISAVLMLWSMRRLSLDSRIFPSELPQLLFNFSSLEFYELLLAGTAIVLARRRVFYDSGLLVGLDNLLVCVPFLLVSQALLLKDSVAIGICLTGCGLAALRVVAFRFQLPHVNFPKPLLAMGAAFLAFNLGWPVLVRILHESRDLPVWDGVGVRLNFWEWNWIVPLFVALAWLLPQKAFAAEIKPDEETPFYSWPSFPLWTLLLWVAGTCLHLYCISYVYTLPFADEMLFPAAWVAAWIPWRFAALFVSEQARRKFERASLWAPAMVVLACVFWGDDARVWPLAALSVPSYAVLWFLRRDRFLAKLAWASAVFALAFAPIPFKTLGLEAVSHWSHGQLLFGLGLACLAGWAIVSTRADVGVLGGMCLGIGLAAYQPATTANFNIAVQAGLAFMLLHSMRWTATISKDAGQMRLFCAFCWLSHAVIWTSMDPIHAIRPTLIGGGLVLIVYFGVRLLFGFFGPRLVAYAATAVTASSPVILCERLLMRMPDGVLILFGSFALFALGTLAALTKSRWLAKIVPATDVEAERPGNARGSLQGE